MPPAERPAPRIISVSRRTDVPAFHAEWFRRRLAAGWCETVNPFSGARRRVSLARDDVLAWVFWSRDYGRFFSILDALRARDERFLCHLTITGFPHPLETATPPSEAACAQAQSIRAATGDERVAQWRYDPLLLTSATPPDWHRENFARLAAALEGATRCCIVSFPTMYRKTARRLAETEHAAPGFRLWREASGDFTREDLAGLAKDLAAVAASRGMELRVCCPPEWARAAGLPAAACVDWPLLEAMGAGRQLRPRSSAPDLFGDAPVPAVSRRPTRSNCGCWECLDVGAYDSCAHGCVYCYAVGNTKAAEKRAALSAARADRPALSD